MTERERLVKLLNKALDERIPYFEKCAYEDITPMPYEDFVADHLLANGVIVAPSKVGDTVYVIPPWWSREDSVSAYKITNFLISNNKKGVWTKKYRAMWLVNSKIVDAQINFRFDDIGKTVFLTREEAEAALKERSEG